MTVLKNKTF